MYSFGHILLPDLENFAILYNLLFYLLALLPTSLGSASDILSGIGFTNYFLFIFIQVVVNRSKILLAKSSRTSLNALASSF